MVINEILCFLTNNWDDFTNECIRDSCLAFYSHEQLRDARKTIFDVYTGQPAKKSLPDDDKKTIIIDDIMNLISVSQPGELPVFVAQVLRNLPCLIRPVEVGPGESQLAVQFQRLQDQLDNFVTETRASFRRVDREIYSISTNDNRDPANPSPASVPMITVILPTRGHRPKPKRRVPRTQSLPAYRHPVYFHLVMLILTGKRLPLSILKLQ